MLAHGVPAQAGQLRQFVEADLRWDVEVSERPRKAQDLSLAARESLVRVSHRMADCPVAPQPPPDLEPVQQCEDLARGAVVGEEGEGRGILADDRRRRRGDARPKVLEDCLERSRIALPQDLEIPQVVAAPQARARPHDLLERPSRARTDDADEEDALPWLERIHVQDLHRLVVRGERGRDHAFSDEEVSGDLNRQAPQRHMITGNHAARYRLSPCSVPRASMEPVAGSKGAVVRNLPDEPWEKG